MNPRTALSPAGGLHESLAQEVNGHGIKVALVEPGIIDTAMATTNLPQYDKGTIYPMGAESMHSSTPATAVTPAVVVRDAEPSPLGLRR